MTMLDGQPVGMASGVPTDQDGVVELMSMYVAPLGRGRGVGDHLLLLAVEQWARLVGAETLRLAVVVHPRVIAADRRAFTCRDEGLRNLRVRNVDSSRVW